MCYAIFVIIFVVVRSEITDSLLNGHVVFLNVILVIVMTCRLTDVICGYSNYWNLLVVVKACSFFGLKYLVFLVIPPTEICISCCYIKI